MSDFSFLLLLDDAQRAEVIVKATMSVKPGRYYCKRLNERKESIAKMMWLANSVNSVKQPSYSYPTSIASNSGAVAVQGNATVTTGETEDRKRKPETTGKCKADTSDLPVKRAKPTLESSTLEIQTNHGAVSVGGNAVVVSHQPATKGVRFANIATDPSGDDKTRKDIALEKHDTAKYYKNIAYRLAADCKRYKEQREHEARMAVHWRNEAHQLRDQVLRLQSQLDHQSAASSF